MNGTMGTKVIPLYLLTYSSEFKEDFLRAGSTVLQRVRSVGRSPSRSPHQLTLSLPGSPPHLNRNSPGSTLLPLPVPLAPLITRSPSTPSTPLTPPSTTTSDPSPRIKTKMSPVLLDILVYTVGVKFHNINKIEVYALEYMFSLWDDGEQLVEVALGA